MTTTNVFGRSLIALGITAALTAPLHAQDAGASSQQGAKPESEELAEILVTGSRTITDVLKSPTPITSVNISELAVTTPSDTADALNKLPQFLAGGATGGRTPRNQGNGSTNNGGNTLSLRNFGPSRTLVLLDGHRVAPNNQDGSVNIDVLPQMLMKNVDIVTGGASAVYGSDAVAGVVNYMLDKNFTGLTVKADYGMSNQSDGDEYQVGGAWGTALFSDRGHFEVSARMRHQDEILMKDRPGGKNGQAWLQTGAGSVTSPFQFTPFSRVYDSGQQGNVICGSGCAVNNMTFDASGNLIPLAHGTPATPGNNIESGGSGAYIKYGTFRSGLDSKDIFARFSLDLGESANWYAQGSWAQAENESDWIQMVASPNAGRPGTLFADNPYLNAASRAALGGNLNCTTDLATPAARASRRCLIATPTAPTTGGPAPPPPENVPTFRLPRYFNVIDGQDVIDSPNRLYRTVGDQKTWNTETGITGEVGGLNWDVFFNHSNSELEVTNPNNTDNAKYLAALDAVNDGGTIKCWVETAASGFQGLYPGCVPMNITTPGGMSAAAYDYVRTPTSWLLTQKMDNVGASIGGGLWGFGLPAGEITANVSVDARWLTYDMASGFNPSEIVNCAGLRLCRASAGNVGAGDPSTQQANPPARWVQNTNGEVSSKNHVYEGALELNIPLLKEVPGFQDLSTNLAGRYTKYSTFDAVESWKIGINWKVVDSVRFRSTLSADIRAPNLNDMFQPVTIGSTSFRDLLTGGQAQGIKRFSQGNALLNPETAKTFTAGIVLTPSFVPRFSWSLDYFQTRLTNAITPLGYDQDATQLTCLASAPAYNASACDLVTRPLSPGDPNFLSQTLNLPTEIRSAPVNAALVKLKGYDMELNYGMDFAGGQFALRHLVTYQPVNSTLATPVAKFYSWAVQPHWMQTTFLSYQNQSWNVALQNRWLGSTSLKNSNNLLNSTNGVPTPNTGAQNYVDSSLDANDVVDITIGKGFETSSGKLEAFLTVSNLLDEHAPLAPSGSGLPGLFYPTLGFYDDMGRFYTAGVKMKF